MVNRAEVIKSPRHVLDDTLFTLGNDNDVALVLKSGTLNANTALTGVAIGTPVAQALPVNSAILSNTTADGDVLMLVNDGGNSKEFLFVDGSEANLVLGHGMATATVKTASGALTLDSGAAINIEPASGSAILLDGTISIDAGVVTGATSVTSTAFLGTIDGVVGGNTPAAITGTTIDANTDFTIGTTVITTSAATFNTDPYILFVGDDANGKMTSGITINQGAADNEAFALKSSDVAHGMTSRAETDTYFMMSKYDANGGVMSRAMTDTGTVGWLLRCHAPSVDSTRDNSATGLFMVDVRKNSGSADTAPDADSNLVVFTAQGQAKFIFDMEGSGHADVEWVAFADHDDIAVINDLENEMLEFDGSPERSKRRHMLEEMGVIGKDSWHIENGRPKAMVNQTKLQMLHHGALMQVGERITALEEENTKMKALVEAIGA
jgi:hypothetical protein